MSKKQSRWQEKMAKLNPDKLAIVLFLEQVLGLSTGANRDTLKNSEAISELTDRSTNTIRNCLYNQGGGRFSAKAILSLLIELSKRMNDSQRRKAKSLEWSVILNHLQVRRSGKWMEFDIGRILSSKSVNLEREEITLPAKKGQLAEEIRVVKEWTPEGVRLRIAE